MFTLYHLRTLLFPSTEQDHIPPKFRLFRFVWIGWNLLNHHIKSSRQLSFPILISEQMSARDTAAETIWHAVLWFFLLNADLHWILQNSNTHNLTQKSLAVTKSKGVCRKVWTQSYSQRKQWQKPRNFLGKKLVLYLKQLCFYIRKHKKLIKYTFISLLL